MSRRYREIEIGDSVYTATPAYRAGAKWAREELPWLDANPHRSGSQAHYDWENGYNNEEDGHHKGVLS